MPEGSEVPINQNEQISPKIKPPEKEFNLDKFQRLKELGFGLYDLGAHRFDSKNNNVLFEDRMKEILQIIDTLDQAFDKDDLFNDALDIFNSLVSLDPFTEGKEYHQILFQIISDKRTRIAEKMKVSGSETRLVCLQAFAKTSYDYLKDQTNQENIQILEKYQAELIDGFKKTWTSDSLPYLDPLLAILEFGGQIQSDEVKICLLRHINSYRGLGQEGNAYHRFKLASKIIENGVVLRKNSNPADEIIQNTIQDFDLDWQEIKPILFQYDKKFSRNEYGKVGVVYVRKTVEVFQKMGVFESQAPGLIKRYKKEFQKNEYRIKVSTDFLLKCDQDFIANDGFAFVKQELKENTGLSQEDQEELIQWWTQNYSSDLLKSLYYTEINLEMIKAIEQKCPGITKVLMKEFGIRDFGRYPEEMLVKQYKQRNNLDLPYGVIIMPFTDWNGAFYHDQQIFRDFFRKIDGRYALRIVECKSLIDIGRILLQLNKRYAPENTNKNTDSNEKTTLAKGHRITFAIIGGHGTANSIQFGNKSPFSELYQEDLSNKGIQRVSYLLDEDPTIILASCSTGQEEGIGQSISKIYKGKVIAPKIPSSLLWINVEFNNLGNPVFSAEYNTHDTRRTYISGKVIN